MLLLPPVAQTAAVVLLLRLTGLERERDALAAEREEMRSRAASAEQEAEAVRHREAALQAKVNPCPLPSGLCPDPNSRGDR